MLQIISAAERLAEKRGHKIVVAGKSGVGKTSLVRTLDMDKTLFMDLEAGDAAIEGCEVDVIRPRTWQECRDFACFLGGGNPALNDDSPYSEAHFEYVRQMYGDPAAVLEKYDTIFIDSITVAGRLCFTHNQNQPEARSDRTGKLDTRAVYGAQGREMMQWLTQLQHIREKNVVFVGILDEKTDDYGRQTYDLQIEGSKVVSFPALSMKLSLWRRLRQTKAICSVPLSVTLSINGAIQQRIVAVDLMLSKNPTSASYLRKCQGLAQKACSLSIPQRSILQKEKTDHA
jgi:hypothetical protein